MNSRFNSETIDLLKSFENFVIGQKDYCVGDIIAFYGKADFDKAKLQLHRDMFLDIVSEKKVKIMCVKEVITFLNANNETGSLLPEYAKLIKILLTVPSSFCTNERTFSALMHLKTYLSPTMGQRRLNNVATLHIHQDVLD